MKPFRFARAAMVVGLAGVMAGCAALPAPDRSVEAVHCYQSRVDRYRKGPCTTAPVPSLNADAQAKRFEADPLLLTVYVVRQSWGDGANVLSVEVDGGPAIETLPDSMVRLRLGPGQHALVFTFEGQRREARVAGSGGDVRFVRLAGTAWAWGSAYKWASEPQIDIQKRAARTRLVADVKP
ncbi:hypothetical protein [Pseudorhodoferax sp. Leaf267]|uniref:hypothetical protein n=1 Tax=Pseudorhodoferax sp. Leaf267 TaxID=1736316 RepID=UPI0006FE5F57|nr:hypothetical protein [Pseudorhodoferax sp. Leaf267]KQP13313.1 hypothetical protein ASF43_18970 [Pseudorhodoferax sp. Leaf267]